MCVCEREREREREREDNENDTAKAIDSPTCQTPIKTYIPVIPRVVERHVIEHVVSEVLALCRSRTTKTVVHVTVILKSPAYFVGLCLCRNHTNAASWTEQRNITMNRSCEHVRVCVCVCVCVCLSQ